jgi:hypothetical protein
LTPLLYSPEKSRCALNLSMLTANITRFVQQEAIVDTTP